MRPGASPSAPGPLPDLLAPREPSRGGSALYALLLLAIALYDLAGRSVLHRDLPRFGVIAREMIASGEWWVPSQHGRPYVNKPILFIWLVAGPSALFGDVTPFLLRLPSALALVVTGLSTASWTRAATGSLAIGRLAGLVVGSMFLVSELGRTGRPDLLVAACSTAAAAAFARRNAGLGGLREVVGAGLACGAGLLSKGPVGLLVPAAVLLLPWPGTTLRERVGRGRPLLVLAIALAVAAAWVLPAWRRAGDGFFQGLVVQQVAERVAGRGNHLEGPFYYLLHLAPVLLPWGPLGAVAALAALSRRGRAVVGATLPSVVGVAVLVLSLVPTKEVRYGAVVAPPLAALASIVLAHLVARTTSATAAGRHLKAASVGALVVGCGFVGLAVRWPAAALAMAPLALAAGAVGALGLASVRRDPSARGRAGRALTVVVALVVLGTLAYWVALGRYLTIRSVVVNREVAAVLPAGVPVVVVVGDRLEPDDLFESVARPIPVHEPGDVPAAAALPRVVVIVLEHRFAAVQAARGAPGRVLLSRPHDDGGTLVVAEFGP